jgi:uncharacterized damage-inducible protein DinB
MISRYFLLPEKTDEDKLVLNHLFAELNFTRSRTIDLVSNLSIDQLDAKAGPGFNSVGTILKHIAANEFYYQLVTFEGRLLNAEERAFWRGASTGELILNLIHGNGIEYYLDLLTQMRNRSFELLGQQNDEWLYKQTMMNFGFPVNNYYSWFHVMEDEVSHTGQMKMLLNQIKQQN